MTSACSVPCPTQTNALPTTNRSTKLLSRLLSLTVLCACLPVIGIAVWLAPDSSGMGTHMQLGLRPCSYLEATGIPCATCGMTTAFSHAAHGNLIQSFIAQPAGMLFCLLLAVMSLLSLYTLVMGISLLPLLSIFWRPRSFLLLGIIVGLAWGYKIMMVQMGY
tara:strand:+ start:42635 stop:43123 length:489 start_codon:yes stop_codon:yes gene_type:complete